MKIDRIIKLMEQIAPGTLAEDWDNVGLQVGSRDWEIDKILVALDPSAVVIDYACKNNFGLLITHHPLIFSPLKRIDLATPLGNLIFQTIKNKVAVFSAHTNLDSVSGGLNDVLCEKLGLEIIKPLTRAKVQRQYKLVVFIPLGHESQMLEAIFQSPAGKIGDYTCCTFRAKGTGTFKPGLNSAPFLGEKGEISHVDEYRLETVVNENELGNLIGKIKQASPYETVAYDVYPVENPVGSEENQAGLGRIGCLPEPQELNRFAQQIKQQLGLKIITVAGAPQMQVKKAAVCTGSGSSLLNHFLATDADVYISGDFRYHDAQILEAHGRGLIDVGHFESERIIVDVLADKLRKALVEEDHAVRVEAGNIEKSPFFFIH